MLNGGGRWDEVWKRFCDAPRLYEGVSAVLRQARARDLLGLVDHSRRPKLNEEQEDKLEKELEAILSLPHAQACERIVALDEQHKERRGWVWAHLGESPYALAPLGRLAGAARTSLGGASVEAMASDYAAEGWRCDRAALEALSVLRPGPENNLITRVVRALYEPWLDQSARRFQELMSASGVDPAKLCSGVVAARETCILFADGLRYDVGAMLREKLELQGFRVRLSYRIAPIPTVTATAKPLASPVHGAISGSLDAQNFCPVIPESSQPVTASRLRDAMARQDVDVMDADESRMAVAGDGGGWAEIGKLDALGHSVDALLVRQIGTELDAIAERVNELIAAGWGHVHVVTDHGWLLLPGGLPKVELPAHLVATKWSWCAAVKHGATPTAATYPWYWNPLLRVASPPGIGAYVAKTAYAHGGISLQECVIPDLMIERGDEAATAEITEIVWRGMRAAASRSKGTHATFRWICD